MDNHKKLTIHSTERACPKCNRSFEPLDPKNFSYNSAQGWCPKCRGFGELFYLPEVERGANADSIEESWWSWAQEREVCPGCDGDEIESTCARGAIAVRSAKLQLLPKRNSTETRGAGAPRSYH